MVSIEAVIFDMDGVILDSETAWHEVRRDFVAEHGGSWTEDDQRAVMGANSVQWAEHIRRRFGVPLATEEVVDRVVQRLGARFSRKLPLLPGAVEAVQRMATRYPLGLASSSPRGVIDLVLQASGLSGCFRAWISSDEVQGGKPRPDVYLAACKLVGVQPANAAAVEDSANGLRAAHAAGLAVVAVPNAAFPPEPEALELADLVIARVADLDPSAVSALR
jgi:HAD superfamily hydrolase (TIGR01509 family)